MVRRIVGTTGTRKLALASAAHLRKKKFKGERIFKNIRVTKTKSRLRIPQGFKSGFDISLENAI